jgi:hypothetical protein
MGNGMIMATCLNREEFLVFGLNGKNFALRCSALPAMCQ